MNRRNFLKTMLLAGVAPAVISSANAMKIYVPPKELVLQPYQKSYLEGIADLHAIHRKQYETV